MRILLAVIFLSVLLTGSTYQSYEQTVGTEGNSIIVKTTDIGLMLGMLGNDVEQQMSSACSADASLRCSVSDGTLMMEEAFTKNDGYYTYEVNYGLPFIEYDLVVKKIPVEKFTERLDDILVAAGLTNGSVSSGEPMNLQDAENNREIALFMRQSGLDISYIIIMPGEIASATAGEVSGTSTGPMTEFMLSEVLQESKPIVVKSQEINWGYIIIIAMPARAALHTQQIDSIIYCGASRIGCVRYILDIVHFYAYELARSRIQYGR